MIKYIEIKILHHIINRRIRIHGFKFLKEEIEKQSLITIDNVPFKVLKRIMYSLDRYCDKYVPSNKCLYRALIAKKMLFRRGYNVKLCNGFDKKNRIFHTWLEDKSGNTIFENGRRYERIF